jgi:hypothetical protein
MNGIIRRKKENNFEEHEPILEEMKKLINNKMS